MSILFAFAAAFTNALDVITQHVASTAAPAKDKGGRLALYLVRNPLWLFGVGAMICSFVLQAVALHKGRVSQVQSIMVTSWYSRSSSGPSGCDATCRGRLDVGFAHRRRPCGVPGRVRA